MRVNTTHLGYRGRAGGRLHRSRLAGGFVEPGTGSDPATRTPPALPGVLAETDFWFRRGVGGFVRQKSTALYSIARELRFKR